VLRLLRVEVESAVVSGRVATVAEELPQLAIVVGHSSITITLDRYGHLMPGNEEQAAGLLDAYLAAEQASTARCLAN
jgi:hypothetical protein